jgi:2-polyprenyl-6-methoxyphenol hydroxylase-like FAD-dependent oxidoreductase
MLPHTGQGANQAIEDAVTLAAVLRDADTVSAPCALRVYESLRRGRCARVQRSSRVNGARYDASGSDLASAALRPSTGARLDLELRCRSGGHGSPCLTWASYDAQRV